MWRLTGNKTSTPLLSASRNRPQYSTVYHIIIIGMFLLCGRDAVITEARIIILSGLLFFFFPPEGSVLSRIIYIYTYMVIGQQSDRTRASSYTLLYCTRRPDGYHDNYYWYVCYIKAGRPADRPRLLIPVAD